MQWIIAGIVGIVIGWIVRHLMAGRSSGGGLESELAAARADADTHRGKVDSLMGEVSGHQQTISTHEATAVRLQGDLDAAKASHAGCADQVAALTAERDRHAKRIAELEAEARKPVAAPAPVAAVPAAAPVAAVAPAAPVAAAPAAAPVAAARVAAAPVAAAPAAAPVAAAPVAAAPVAAAPAAAPVAAPNSPALPSSGDIEEIEGIGPAIGDKMRGAGVPSIARLLERGATKQGRADLAAAVGQDPGRILSWVNHADLMRVRGVGPQEAELLEAAGIDSPAELAQRNSANLHAKLHEVNAAGAKKIVASLEVEMQHVQEWIDAAKGLAKHVTH